jgi:hypothetical protein
MCEAPKLPFPPGRLSDCPDRVASDNTMITNDEGVSEEHSHNLSRVLGR